MNTLVVIGYTEIKRCYLNVDREEAIRRYTVEDGQAPDKGLVKEFTFDDSFEAYDAWVSL